MSVRVIVEYKTMENDRRLPNPEQRVFGRDMFELGYAAGYQKANNDTRKRRVLKEKKMRERFNLFADYVEDLIASRRRH